MELDYFPPLPELTENERSLLCRKVDVDKRYGLPKDVRYCKTCVITNQRPRILFDKQGECSACKYWKRKESEINWSQRESELAELCDRYRRNDGSFDVLVPSSGGKDSVYVAHLLKHKYDMHPLTMTWAPHVYTDIGYRNFQAHIHAGLDNVTYTPNGLVHRRMTRLASIEIGDPFQPFIYGVCNLPLRVAIDKNISLIMDGENGEAEYGGDPSTENAKGFSTDDANEYWLSDFPVEYWQNHGFSQKDLKIYNPPSIEEIKSSKIERHFFSYYKNWRPQDHYYYCVNNVNFLPNPKGRSEGTFSKYASLDDRIDPYHYYFSYLKFGIARATSDAAHEIREKLIDRDEGFSLVKRYDSEEPSNESKNLFLNYTGLNEDQLKLLCDRWTNERLFEITTGIPKPLWED